jgi:hypothetical protein
MAKPPLPRFPGDGRLRQPVRDLISVSREYRLRWRVRLCNTPASAMFTHMSNHRSRSRSSSLCFAGFSFAPFLSRVSAEISFASRNIGHAAGLPPIPIFHQRIDHQRLHTIAQRRVDDLVGDVATRISTADAVDVEDLDALDFPSGAR